MCCKTYYNAASVCWSCLFFEAAVNGIYLLTLYIGDALWVKYNSNPKCGRKGHFSSSRTCSGFLFIVVYYNPHCIYADIGFGEIIYKCMGVNRRAFCTILEHNGENPYTKLRKLLKNPECFDKEQVRNEMILKLGCYVTESSGHNSEYNQRFRKRSGLIEKYSTYSTN